MTANSEESSMSNDDIQALLDTFMEAGEEESQRILNQHGHILLSDNALQLVRDQITELSTIILPTLKKKLQLLEEAKRLRADAERLHPEQALSVPPPELQDLLETLSTRRDPYSLMPDQTAIADIMTHMPPESIFQFFQQFLSSPQKVESLLKLIQKTQNMSDDQAEKDRGELYTSLQYINGMDAGLLRHLLQKVWELPPEQRESIWRGDQPKEELMNLSTDIYAYITQHNLDISALINPQPLQASEEWAMVSRCQSARCG